MAGTAERRIAVRDSRVVGPYARAGGMGEGWALAERRACRLLGSFLVSNADREAYFAHAPAADARYLQDFAHALEHMGGHAPVEALRVARTPLPDITPCDPSRPACFPHNGRTLTDDAADAFLPVLTNGRKRGEKVGPHRDLLAEFHYLGPPHVSRLHGSDRATYSLTAARTGAAAGS